MAWKKHIQQFVYFYNFKRLYQNLNYNTHNNVYNKIVNGNSLIYPKIDKSDRKNNTLSGTAYFIQYIAKFLV